MNELIKRIIPVFLIIFIGYIIKHKNIISDSGIRTLKSLIMTIFLPASMFFAFLQAELTMTYIFIIVIVFLLCVLLYTIGFIFKKKKFLDSIYTAEFFTGFEFGMMGIALFSGIFGLRALSTISIIALGHEFFIWFVYLPLLQSHSNESSSSIKKVLLSFIKSPIIISIISAVILNISGLSLIIYDNFITGGVLVAFEWLSSATVSVVLIILGSSLGFAHLNLAKSLKYILFRFAFALIVIIPMYFLIRRIIPALPELFTYAWITFFILPPPYIIPIYVPEKSRDENTFLSNTIVLYTMISLSIFLIILFIYPPVL